jgi:hypothetical protein
MPETFWAMSPGEFWFRLERSKPPERVGSMLKSEFDSLREML